MNKNIIIQIILIITVFFIILIFLNKYFFNDKSSSIETIDPIKEISEDNLIKNLKYNSINDNGDKYELSAEYGSIDTENPEILYLTNVKGYLSLDNNYKITISSENAKFNNKSFETTFKTNIEINTNEEKIYGDELYIVFNLDKKELEKRPLKIENKAILSNNIRIIRSDYEMQADVVEIDLITNDSKVYMHDKNEKVIIKNF